MITNLQAERAALAAALTNPEAAIRLSERSTPDDWPKPYRAIFEGINTLVNEGTAPDAVLLSERFPDAVKQIGGPMGFGGLLGEIAYPSMIDEYTKQIQQNAARRRLAVSIEAAVKANNEREPVEKIAAELERATIAARESVAGAQIATSSTLDRLYSDLWDWWGSEDDALTRFKYPIEKLNSAYGGYGAGELLVVTGYSGDGKSIVGLQFFEALTAAGENAAYFSLEMPALQVGRRLIAMGGVPIWRMKTSEQRNDGYLSERALKSVSRLDKRPGRVYGGSTTIGRITAEQARHKYSVIIVDHLHRMPYREREDLEATVRAFKNLALDTGCAVILLCQLARRDGFPRPTLAQLRDTAVIEHEADGVFAIYRRRKDGMRTEDAELVVLKMRDGESDVWVNLAFRPERLSFVELDASERGPVERTEPYKDSEAAASGVDNERTNDVA